MLANKARLSLHYPRRKSWRPSVRSWGKWSTSALWVQSTLKCRWGALTTPQPRWGSCVFCKGS